MDDYLLVNSATENAATVWRHSQTDNNRFVLRIHLIRQGNTIQWIEIVKGPQSHNLVSTARDQETSVLRKIHCADVTRLTDKVSAVKQFLRVNLLTMNRRAIESKGLAFILIQREKQRIY